MRSGRRLAGRYRLDALLGRGGMGEVWRAQDLRLNRTVAVKMLPSRGASEQAVARFRREAEIAAGLQHPGIAVVYDVDTDRRDDGDGTLFLVMELLRGTDLAALTEAHPNGLPVERATQLLVQIAEALAEAHDNDVVHRDIKPSNVMLLDGDRTKILDFGIARYAEQTTDLTGSAMIGTPAFMAPEQFDDTTPVDHRTDLYALGGVAYQLLTGRRPFTADTMPKLLHAVLLTPAPAVSDTRPDVPEDLDHLVAELLAKNPDDRPGNAHEVAARLRAITPREQAPTAPVQQTLEETAPAPPPQPPRTPSPGRFAETRNEIGVLFLVITVLFVAAFIVVQINPGGALMDEGAYSEVPSCSDLRPAAFSDAAPSGHRSDEDGADCGWKRYEGRRELQFLHVYLTRVGTDIWASAPEHARKTLAEERARGGPADRERSEPHPGQDAYSYYHRSSSVSNMQTYTVAFRDSNIIATVRYTTDSTDTTPSSLHKAALKLAHEVHRLIKPRPGLVPHALEPATGTDRRIEP